MTEDKICIKKEGEVCLFCPFCGKQALHMSATEQHKFYCPECDTECILTKPSEG